MILRALGAEPPVYAHLPLLHGPDGKKLSKRHGAASVQELRDAGYLPEALRNYVALLGWGYDETTTFMTTAELIERFSLERVSKNPAVFDEQKLRSMNGRYLRELAPDDLRGRLEALAGRDVPPEAVAISQEKMQTLADFWPLAGFLVERPAGYDEKAWEKVMGDGGARAAARRPRAHSRPRRSVRRGARSRPRCGRGGAVRGQAEGRVPADSRGDHRHDGVAGDLRVGGRARARGDAGAHRRRACPRRAPRRNSSVSPSTFRPALPIARVTRARMSMEAAMNQPAEPAQEAARRHNEGHGRRLTAAFEALEAFPALAESRNRVLRVVREDRASVGEVVRPWSPTSRS